MTWQTILASSSPMVCAIGVSYVFNHLARWVAPRIGLVDKPDGGRKVHKQPTPVMGGVAFISAAMLVLLLAGLFRANWLADDATLSLATALGWSALCFCVLGACDDRWPLSPRVKLVGQALASCPFVILNGVVDSIGVFQWEIPLGPLGGLITVFWLVACANVVNLIDGMDGLAGSIGIVVLATITALFGLKGFTHEAMLTSVIAGSILGFLIHNWPPARIFMGDAGSMTIGFLAGAMSIQASSKTATTFTLAVPLVLMSIPFFDTSMAILRRKLTGRSIGEGDRGHIHHRLQDRGMSRQQALLAICGLTLIMAGAVLMSVVLKSEILAMFICVGVLVLLILGRVFGYHETSLVFRHLQELGGVLIDSSGVLQTRLLLARLDINDARQRVKLWDQVVSRVSQMKAAKLEYHCRSIADERITTRLSWDSLTSQPAASTGSWQIVYQVPREEGVIATLEARGHATGTSDAPRVDDLMRLFARVALELPIRDESTLQVAPTEPVGDEASILAFPPRPGAEAIPRAA